MYSFQNLFQGATHARCSAALSATPRSARDERLREDLGLQASSPWDFIFFMDKALNRDLEGSGHSLAVDDRVGGRIDRQRLTTGTRRPSRARTARCRPRHIEGGVRGRRPAIKPMVNAKMIDDKSALVTSRLTSGSSAAARSRRRSISADARSRSSRWTPVAGSPIASVRQRVAQARAERHAGRAPGFRRLAERCRRVAERLPASRFRFRLPASGCYSPLSNSSGLTLAARRAGM